ncbi:putative lipoprotein YajG [Pseudorhizobium tarimense]|uniref:Lipoprotein YajG n=1 Tax=Pseudorhizobium tarimense TaxID=1079109 RepID=A0ABV2H3E5_9HYPH
MNRLVIILILATLAGCSTTDKSQYEPPTTLPSYN